MKNSLLLLRIFLLLAILPAGSCRRAYEPPAVKTDYKFLVVEGNINTAVSGITVIRLSRTKMINDTTTFLPEKGANVFIESETGALYQLAEQSPGIYSASLNLNGALTYRLKIVTAGQQDILSDFTASKVAPPIDSITWEQDENNDVDIYVNAHDPANQTHYYQWEYVETWEYDSRYETGWATANGLAFKRDSANQIHTCWISANSENILVGSSVKLSEDVISRQPLLVIPKGKERISKRYSILARQYALTKEAYEYWQQAAKNTQQPGTLFDAQPTQLTGNIHNISNPAEPVIGYVSAGTAQGKRIFINHSEVRDWASTDFGPPCDLLTIPQPDPNNSLVYTYPDTTVGIYYFVTGGIVVVKNECIDCTRKGGSTVKPAFW